MFQEAARTNPVTTDAQTIGSATNFGSESPKHADGTANLPIWKANITGTLGAARFDSGSSQHLDTNSNSSALGTVSCLSVWKYDTAGTVNDYIFSYGLNVATHVVSTSDTPQTIMGGNTKNGTSVSDGELVACFSTYPTVGDYLVDWSNEVGSQTATITHSDLADNIISVGAQRNGGQFSWHGDIHEIVMWASETISLDDVKAYVEAKYGLTWL
jgi:hypothetical protein